jgi:hypothetical protein
MRKKLLTILIICAAWGWGQSPSVRGEAEYRRIVQGMQALGVSIALDRQEYLQGEQIEATVTVSNPTAGPISAFAPFRSPYTSLSLSTLNQQGEWQVVGAGELGIQGDVSDMMAERKVVTIGVHDRLTQKISMIDTGDSSAELIHHAPVTILPPGPYRIRFGYERPAQASFRVIKIEAKLTAVAKPLPEAERFRNKKSGISKGCAGMWTAALRTTDRTVLVSSVSGSLDVCRSKDPDLETLLRLLSPFTRVAEAPDGVRSISLESLEDGKINMGWEDGQGRPRQQVLPSRQFR